MMVDQQGKGPLAWMARNPVAANLLMVLLLLGGFIGSKRIKQEVFPEFELDMINVSVAYPGAAPREVEQGIVLAIEEAVRGIDGVNHVNSTTVEGLGTVSIELLLKADPDRVLADVKSAVDRITTFPEDAERPVVSLAQLRSEVIHLVISGDQEVRVLHDIGEHARIGLLARDEVTQVELYGVPPLEISIEIPRESLDAYGLTLEQVAAQVRAHSLELPGGSVKTDSGEILVRLADRRRSGPELENVIVRGTAGGGEIRLGDIATIRDDYQDADKAYFYNGRRAMRLTAYRVGDETPTTVSQATHAYADQLRTQLPANIHIDIWDDDSELLEARIGLLVDNAKYGLFLVVFLLALVLNLRLAFWVSLGIPISFLGAMLVLPAADMSINMLTLFGFIVTLGLVVDDAIIVGENIFEKQSRGMPRSQAAIEGTKEMVVPVSFAILTSIAAFSPLFFVPGTMGKVFGMIPMVVVLVLFFSWVESFFILPAHLAHGRERERKTTGVMGLVNRIQDRVAAGLKWHNERVFEPVLRRTLRYRYIAVSMAMAVFLISLGMVLSGVLPFNFMPRFEGDVVRVSVRFPYGTPVKRSEEAAKILETAAFQAIEDSGGQQVVRGMFTRVGEGIARRHGTQDVGSHVASIELELVPTDQRDFTSEEFSRRWESHVPEIPGVVSLLFNSSAGPGAAAAVDVQMSHADDQVLAAASEELAEMLRSYSALTSVDNSYASGKTQLDYKLSPHAASLGITGNDVARQIRAAFFGAEALREQRGRNEIRVMVRLPEEQRTSEYDVEELLIRAPAGGHVPLSYVADVERSRAPTTIFREDGIRAINVSASLAPGAKSSREILESLKEGEFPALKKEYPGLSLELVGRQREQNEAFAALRVGYFFALLAIYGLLAIPFKSYFQPLIIMSAIPFGFIGAVAGHLLMGYEMTLVSLFGIIALSGVVVNDSLVLIDRVNRNRKEGQSATEALVSGALRRFRPILLTSLTTFIGLAPMIFENSPQARFLVPMAISLGYGILVSTFIILLIVPSLYLILEDAREFLAGSRGAAPGTGQQALEQETA